MSGPAGVDSAVAHSASVQAAAFAERRSLRALQREGMERHQLHRAHRARLSGAVASMHDGVNVSNDELDELVKKFIAWQAASQDHCSARLLEAKHQMNRLRERLAELASVANMTEAEVDGLHEGIAAIHEDLASLDDERQADLARCRAKSEADTAMWRTLQGELLEMQQIAHPNVTLELKGPSEPALLAMGARVSGVPLASAQQLVRETRVAASGVIDCVVGAEGSHAEEEAVAALEMGASAQSEGLGGGASCHHGASALVVLGGATHTAHLATELQDGALGSVSCGLVAPSFRGLVWLQCRDGVVVANATSCVPVEGAKSKEQCADEKAALEGTFVKAYVELARLATEYEELSRSTACPDAVLTEFSARRAPIEEKSAKMKGQLEQKLPELGKLRPELRDLYGAEQRLRRQIERLGEECTQVPETLSSLQRVRDTIDALATCPGTFDPKLTIPESADDEDEHLESSPSDA